MKEAVGSKSSVRGKVPQESPLVPNKKLQQMYQGMVESRLLEQRLAKRLKKKLAVEGQEACRAAALVDLHPEDLTSDLPGVISSSLLRGASPASLLAAGKKRGKDVVPAQPLAGVLPALPEADERIRFALGAALTIKRMKLGKLAILFAQPSDLRPKQWKELLGLAASEELPVLFVALPESGKRSRTVDLLDCAHTAGIPGIPVDSSDAIALYRVVQESFGRLRAGGSPVLMQCISFTSHGKKEAADPIEHMRESMLARGACDKAWLDAVQSNFRRRLKQ